MEMGIKRKLEQCEYNDSQKNILVKLLGGFIFIFTLQCSLVTSVFLVLSWTIAIIASGLW